MNLDEEMENLFSYGTLQDESVQLSIFGRRLSGEQDVLVGYRLRMIHITDQEFIEQSGSAEHRTLMFTGRESNRVEGAALKLTKAELAAADEYEPAGYERKLVKLKSGIEAWVYVNSG